MNTYPDPLKRIASFIYDSLLCLACLFVFVGIIVTINKGNPINHNQEPFVSAGLFLIISFYFIGFWRQGGQTPGMKVWKIKLVSDNQSAKLSQLIIRFLLALFTLGLGIVYCFFNEKKLSLYDVASKTSLRNVTSKKK